MFSHKRLLPSQVFSVEKADNSKATSKSLQNPEKMKRFLLLQMTFLYLCSFTDGSEDVEFSLEVIKEKADYENLCFTCSVILVGVNGNLQKFTTYSTGYLESVIKVTKNYSGPKIQYLGEAGIMKIHSGEIPMEEVDFNVFGAEASIHVSGTGAGYSAKVNLVGGKVSILELELGVGVSSEIGLIDDSVAVRFLGVGGSIGRKNKICVLDNCFGIDLGALFG